MNKKVLFAIIFLLLLANAYASAPVIFYSDLTSGPNTGGQNNKGAFVTIWGNNFGATRGSSYVSIGGGQADNYPVWSDTKVSFQLGANAATGNITVTTSEGPSNGVSFTVRSGNIYFVSTSGDNGNAGSYASPWRSWQYAASTMAAGDIIYGRGGSYTATADNGTDGRCIKIESPVAPGGSTGNPKAFVAYPGEIPILYPPAISGQIILVVNQSYLVFSQLYLYNPTGTDSTDASSFGTTWNSDGNTTSNTNIRFVGNVCRKNYLSAWNAMSAAVTACNGSDIQILGNKVYDVGNGKQEHGIYLNEALTNAEVGWNEVYDVHNGYGIEIYNDYQAPYVNCIVHDNLIYRIGRCGIQLACPGTYKVYNNILWDCGQITFSGLRLSGGGATKTFEIYNNIFYDNGQNELTDAEDDPGSEPFGQIHLLVSEMQSLIFRNNIIRSLNSSETYWKRDYTGSTQTFSNNLYYGNGGKPSFDNGSSTLNTDPLLYNPTTDFHLQSSSPCRDAGYDLGGTVSTDYDGISRPQGTRYDIGAYEYAVDSTPPAAVTDLGAGSVSTTTVVLGWTAPGNDGNFGRAASYDIRYSTYNITDANWSFTTQVTGEPSPSIAGTVEVFTISNLTAGTTYYFALRAFQYNISYNFFTF
jgi:hypothetical protein